MLITFGAVHEHLQLALLTPLHTAAIDDAEEHVRNRLKQEWPQDKNFILKHQMHKVRESD